MEWDKDQEAYQASVRELNQIHETTEKQRRALKKMEENDYNATLLKKRTEGFIEEMYVTSQDSSASSYLQDQFDVILTDLRREEQSRFQTYDEIQQKLRNLKKAEEAQEEKQRDLRSKRERSRWD